MPLISATGKAEGGAETSLQLDKASSGSSTTKTSVFGDSIPTETSKSAIYRWQWDAPQAGGLALCSTPPAPTGTGGEEHE